MNFTFAASLSACGLFLGMMVLFEIGRRIGIGRRDRDPDGIEKGSGPVHAAVFGLLGLLLAFTFSGAASRFEDRRHLITEEANAIGTAYLRVDTLPPETQPELRQLFTRYLDARVASFRNVADVTATKASLSAAATLQGQIWAKAVSASERPQASTHAAMLLLPALNQMIDITATRASAMENHPPEVIFFLLAGLSLVSSLLVGYVTCASVERSWFYMLLVAATMSLTFYVILDLEYPRFGLIRIDGADQILIDLRSTMR